ncbi:MAG: sulfotransferase domain-containing protein [Myxococcota bacterium]|nr:sulfotransferase domain-containing protein [Myxococcota bacterium]
MRHMIRKKLARFFVRRAYLVLPEERAQTLERRHRGKEELRKLRMADHVVVSYPKSGRTWLRTLLSRYYQLSCDLSEQSFLGFDNLHARDARVPRILFTHDNYLRVYTGHLDSKRDYFDQSLLLLVRRPQDVAASQFFQWKFRMRPRKMPLNQYPEPGSDISMYDFVMGPEVGMLARIVDYMNDWAAALPHIPRHHVVRYEDLRARTAEELAKVVEFLGGVAKPEWIEDAVQFGSVENMRSMEKNDFFWLSGSRLQARDVDNPSSYKVRRAVVGGYRDYFDDEQVARIDALVSERLTPAFGYLDEPLPASEPAEAATGASS